MKEVLPHKKTKHSEHSFKANKKFGNQKIGNNLVLQNRFETPDVESNLTAYELPDYRENLYISNPSNNTNNSLNNNFSKKLNSTRQRPKVVINQSPGNNDDYQKFVPGDKLYSEVGKHHSSTSNNNKIIEISFLKEQDLAISLERHQRISYVMSMQRYKTQCTMPS